MPLVKDSLFSSALIAFVYVGAGVQFPGVVLSFYVGPLIKFLQSYLMLIQKRPFFNSCFQHPKLSDSQMNTNVCRASMRLPFIYSETFEKYSLRRIKI